MNQNSDKRFYELSKKYSLIRLSGKQPVESGWQKYCTYKRDFHEIGFTPQDNAGIACGVASGIVVLDVDDEEKFKGVCEREGWTIPETMTIRTGSGKLHYYFQYPDDGKTYGNRALKSYGFDIRGEGGQVVAPHSIHPDTGRAYEIERDIPPVEPPTWLIGLMEKRTVKRRKHEESSVQPDISLQPFPLDSLPDSLQELITTSHPEGTRSEKIWRALYGLVDANLTDSQVLFIFENYPIGEKYREKCESRQTWLLGQVDKVREKTSIAQIEYSSLPEIKKGTIPNDVFVDRMEKRWTQDLNNVPSEALRQTWKQLCDAFNSNIHTHFDPQTRQKWWIVQPATGTGKTQSAILYCSMLSELPECFHPGALIVTRLIDDADLIAKQINDLVSDEVAFAYHSRLNPKVSLMALGNWPVLVITHRAYEMALDFLGEDGSIQQTWPFFHEFNGSTRQLVIIDECLDIVEHSQVDLDSLRQTLAAIPQCVRDRLPNQILPIDTVISAFEQMNAIAENKATQETMLLKHMVEEGMLPDLTPLRRELRMIRFDHQIGRHDDDVNEQIRKRHDNVLRSLNCVFKSWLYYAKINTKHTLNTARLLVPEGVKGAVVLDATASSNVIYQLFDDAVPLKPPDDARDYRNVTLHVSKGHSVGKVYMKKNAPTVCTELINELNKTLLNNHDVFIVTHKDVEPFLLGYHTEFQYRTSHWGKVDGSNEWKDCDTCIVFGLPYRPDTWTANVFMAYQGPQDTEWLRAEGNRPFKNHHDIRQALKVGQIVTDVVQAVNRVQCRKVIDDDGNCPNTDIYIMLPNNFISTAILNGIQSQMPGVQVAQWDMDKQKVKVRKSNHEESLLKYLENMDSGRVSKSMVQKILGISKKWMQVILNKLIEDGSRLTELGIRIEKKREGKSDRVYFVKD